MYTLKKKRKEDTREKGGSPLTSPCGKVIGLWNVIDLVQNPTSPSLIETQASSTLKQALVSTSLKWEE